MTEELLRLRVIVGSVRQERFGLVPARWFLGTARAHGSFDVELVDLADTALPLSLGPEPPSLATYDARPPEMAALTRALSEADAFVVVTPEYNHSFPASLKCAIDWHYEEWRGKPVGFVSYGGPGGGLRAVEQLRLVFAELHATTVRSSVTFPNFWERFDESGEPLGDGAAEEARSMLEELAWWGTALRAARQDEPLLVA